MTDHVNDRFRMEREISRAELHRVEDVLSMRIMLLETELQRLAARVKYLEERRP